MAGIFILGAGGFGTALAVMASRQGHGVTLWSPFDEEVGRLSKTREQPLLPGVTIPPEVTVTTSPEALGACELAVFATPSQAVRETAKMAAGHIGEGAVVACVSKGFEPESFKTLGEVLEEELPRNRVVIISGPSHAEEVSRGVPTTVVAASRSRAAAEYVQDILSGDAFRIYAGDDVVGVELGGALKNVIALAAGILDGLKTGDNTKAALMTRGLAEISRLGVVMGARSETFAGLSGVGDLIVTCSSMHSRNRRCGILIGEGVPPAEAVKQIGMTVEGYAAAKTAHGLALRHGVEMPITAEVYKTLYEGEPPLKAVKNLMGRPKRHESEAIWLLSGRK
ncbi:MAG: NAD(P)-dependent glycerol-3-phosphate dehydrogenase [Oscillospiraceae bacterium]|jgi:glycerol-3-phosphate dehydrogenase (NAD(P)+)|nr:NAD(P)-dependent glycerol-3-phosphate dehydrogenase [Oscillospiraceae bacterium]